jgi:AraC-like DNA-binding protein
MTVRTRLSISSASSKPALEEFRDQFARTIMGIDLNPLGDAPFEADLRFQELPSFGLCDGELSAVDTLRTSELINDDNPVLAVIGSGFAELTQAGRRAEVANGNGVLTTGGEPGRFTLLGDVHLTSLRFDRSKLRLLVPDLDAAIARVIPADSTALKLLCGYASIMSEQDSLATPELQTALTTHVYDLAALAIGATLDAAETAMSRGVRAARLYAIKKDIRANPARPDLSPDTVALRQGVSPRYIRKLFHDEGTTFTAYLLEQRLERAHAMLGNQRLAEQSISSIAFTAGFNDVSHFNRTFRRRYGMTPTDHRHAALRGK